MSRANRARRPSCQFVELCVLDIWKEFDHNIVTHSAAHHLMAVDDLVQRLGYARVSDIARQLNITRGSVSISLQPLKKAGLIVQDENRHLRLSEEGQALVDTIKTKRDLMRRLFAEVLGVSPEQAEIDACKMEHLLSNVAGKRLVAFLRFFESGHPDIAAFRAAWHSYDASCNSLSTPCPGCEVTCLADKITD